MEAKESGLLDQAIPTETHSVDADAYDAAMFKALAVESAALRALEEAGLKKSRTFPPLLEDAFAALFKVQPELREESLLKTAYRLNRTIMERVLQAPSYAELRSYTRLDDLASAIGTATLGEYLLKQLPEKITEKAEALAAQLDRAQDATDKAVALRDLGDDAQAKEWENMANDACASAQALKTLLDELLKDHAATLRQITSQAAKSALGEVRETMEQLEAWGLGPGSPTRVPAEERIALARRVRQSEKLKQLAKLVGKFRRLAITCQERKWKVGRDEIYDVTLGSDIARVLPSELILLRRPATKLLFYRKFVEGGLLTYALRGQEKIGKGPIILCLDESGTMAGAKELWGKALALGLLEIAAMQKRDFTFIAFGSQTELAVTRFQKGQIVPAAVVVMAEHFFGGGTDFARPVGEALDLIREGGNFKQADIVFVTDGECGVTHQWVEWCQSEKKKMGVTLHGILVDRGSTSPTTVKQFADSVQFSSSFTMEDGEALAKETFLAI